jgi:hypothetical protein
MALGADAARILRMVMSQGAWQLAIGLVLGAGASRCSSVSWRPPRSKNILFKVDPLDPTIYLAVRALLTLVAALVRVFCPRVAPPASIPSSRCATE